jgi:predicted nucleic acid-binding protein
MSEPTYLLDTSALLTLIEDEAGAARVEELLREQRVTIPWTCLLEVTSITRQERGVAEAERRYALLKSLPITLVWHMEEATLLAAARLRATHRISLADAVIAAYALRTGTTLVHKDPEYEALAGEIQLEALPYKNP